MLIDVRVVGPFEENAYLLACARTREAVLIDPGDEAQEILEMVRAHGAHVLAILNTHGHLDHVCAAAELRSALAAPFRLHAADRFLLDALPAQAEMFGLILAEAPEVDQPLEDGETIAVGDLRVRVMHTPGHSPGGVSFLAGDALFSGDTLFFGSIGRTDLPGGDDRVLISSIRNRLLPLGDDVRVFPGHGPETTLGSERLHNPFLL